VLKNAGKVSLLLRLGRHVCVCLPNRRLNGKLRASIRPWVIGWLACWCDRSTTG